jgi:hypothetical protein
MKFLEEITFPQAVVISVALTRLHAQNKGTINSLHATHEEKANAREDNRIIDQLLQPEKEES